MTRKDLLEKVVKQYLESGDFNGYRVTLDLDAGLIARLIADGELPWCINTGKSLIPLTLRFLAQKRNLLIPLELSRVMHQGT